MCTLDELDPRRRRRKYFDSQDMSSKISHSSIRYALEFVKNIPLLRGGDTRFHVCELGHIRARLAKERSTYSTSSFSPRRWRQYIPCGGPSFPRPYFLFRPSFSPALVLYLHLMLERLKESMATSWWPLIGTRLRCRLSRTIGQLNRRKISESGIGTPPSSMRQANKND